LPAATLFDGLRTLAITPLADRDLLAIDSDVPRRFDPDANLGPVDRHDGDFDVIADAQSFASPSSQYEHKVVRNGLQRVDCNVEGEDCLWAIFSYCM
jgi:hypothetical protein